MHGFPPGYHVDGATWVYLSAVLITAIYFRFSRIWSLRNLDLALMLAAPPGLLLARQSEWEQLGFVWLFVTSGLFLVRLLIDPWLQRRPVLGQNLNASGLGFLGIATLVLLTSASIQRELPSATARVIEDSQRLLGLPDTAARRDMVSAATGVPVALPTASLPPPTSAVDPEEASLTHGPAAAIIATTGRLISNEKEYAARGIAMLAHIAVALGLLFAGRNLCSQLHLGVAMATLYLLHPATALDVSAATHVLPAALIIWALVCFRYPLVAGMLMGLACGTLFFPLFLLPLWLAFYGRRGSLRFATSLFVVFAVLFTTLVLTTDDPNSLIRRTLGTLHLHVMHFEGGGQFHGFWSEYGNGWFRIPVIAAYLVMLVTLTFWPRQKNIEHLITASAAAIVGTQFWYPQEGGVYVLWYLPLVILVTFRPRLVHLTPPASALTAEELAARPGSTPLPPTRGSSTMISRANLYR
ncbi:MAG: hypothetical protein ACK5Q5_19935 [Planctomycetaceae bacterium]